MKDRPLEIRTTIMSHCDSNNSTTDSRCPGSTETKMHTDAVLRGQGDNEIESKAEDSLDMSTHGEDKSDGYLDDLQQYRQFRKTRSPNDFPVVIPGKARESSGMCVDFERVDDKRLTLRIFKQPRTQHPSMLIPVRVNIDLSEICNIGAMKSDPDFDLFFKNLAHCAGLTNTGMRIVRLPSSDPTPTYHLMMLFNSYLINGKLPEDQGFYKSIVCKPDPNNYRIDPTFPSYQLHSMFSLPSTAVSEHDLFGISHENHHVFTTHYSEIVSRVVARKRIELDENSFADVEERNTPRELDGCILTDIGLFKPDKYVFSDTPFLGRSTNGPNRPYYKSSIPQSQHSNRQRTSKSRPKKAN